jgi:hypothetical protein
MAITLATIIESYMIATGTTTSPLINTDDISYISAPWINTTKQILQHTGTTIVTPTTQCLQLLRVNDVTIMNIAAKQQLPLQQLQKINNCRIWLQITTLAEITDIGGSELLTHCISGASNQTGQPLCWNISRSRLYWPHQAKPDKS